MCNVYEKWCNACEREFCLKCVFLVQCVRVESPAPSQFYDSLLCTDSCHPSQVDDSHSVWRHAWCRVRGTSNITEDSSPRCDCVCVYFLSHMILGGFDKL